MLTYVSRGPAYCKEIQLLPTNIWFYARRSVAFAPLSAVNISTTIARNVPKLVLIARRPATHIMNLLRRIEVITFSSRLRIVVKKREGRAIPPREGGGVCLCVRVSRRNTPLPSLCPSRPLSRGDLKISLLSATLTILLIFLGFSVFFSEFYFYE